MIYTISTKPWRIYGSPSGFTQKANIPIFPLNSDILSVN